MNAPERPVQPLALTVRRRLVAPRGRGSTAARPGADNARRGETGQAVKAEDEGVRRMRSPRGRRAATSVVAVLALLASMLVGATTFAGSATAAPTYSIKMSTSASRANPVSLAGRTVHGGIYVFAVPGSGANRVSFYVDDSSRRRAPVHTESDPPYDLNGGSASSATAFDTRRLPNGRHSVTIYVELPGGQASTSTATFTVANAPKAPVATATGGNRRVVLTWGKVDVARTTGFDIFRSRHKPVDLTRRPVAHLGKDARRFVDSGLNNGDRYFYKVVARGIAGTKKASSTVGAVPRKPIPPTVSSFTAVRLTSGSVRLAWKVAGSPTRVEVWRVLGATGTPSRFATLSGSARSFTDAAVKHGKTYVYVIHAWSVVPPDHERSARRTMSIPALAYASDVTPAQTGPTTATVSWTHGTGDRTGYELYRSTAAGALGTKVGATLAPSVSSLGLTGLTPGQRYYFTVRTLAQGGAVASAAQTAAFIMSPLAPTGVDVYVSGSGVVTVSWNVPAGTRDGYRLYRDGSATPIPAGKDADQVVDSETALGARYSYTLVAFSGSKESNGVDKQVEITPSQPSISASYVGGEVHVVWSGGSGTRDGYRLYRSTAQFVGGDQLGTFGAGATGYDDSDVSLGTTYWYTVVAYTGGYTAESAQIPITLPAPPAAPDGLAVTADGPSLDLSWNAVSDATYTVYRSTTEGELGPAVATGLLATDWEDADVTDGTTYFYTVKAVRMGLTSGPSAQVSFTFVTPSPGP